MSDAGMSGVGNSDVGKTSVAQIKAGTGIAAGIVDQSRMQERSSHDRRLIGHLATLVLVGAA